MTNAQNQQTTYNYADCNVGKPTSIVDANGTTTIQYNDPLDRPTHGTLPDGANVDYQYSTDLKTVTVVKDLDAGRRTTTSTTTDGLGRIVQTVDAAGVATVRSLDALGRLHVAYNPGSTTAGTSYTYDGLNRTATITYADGSPESFQWTGDLMVHTDPSPTSTQQQVDALGRILQMIEDYGGANLATTYTYDALDNLRSVTQPGLQSITCATGEAHSRCFEYDSLKQLTSANNPETAAITYAYDPDGNLSQRTQGAVTTSFQYDPLDRLSFKNYVGINTPPVTNCYDGAGSVAGTADGSCVAGSVPNATGRLTETRNSVSKTSYSAYDPMGRVLNSVQTTSSQGYSFSYAYNLAGELTRTTYPSGRSVMNYYDAAGRVCSVSGTQANPPPLPSSCNVAGSSQVTAYANNVSYTPQGSLQSMARGDGLAETWGYNVRLQPNSINVGSVFGMNLYYCPGQGSSCTTNNGNVMGEGLTAPSMVQVYGYDKLNRLTSMQEGANTQTWQYDNLGNRWVTSGASQLPQSSFLPTAQAQYNAQNQLTSQVQGAQYGDGRGNLTAIGAYVFNYEAENRLASSQLNTTTETYGYDGDGRRVVKQNASGTTTYVYDAMGQMAAEYGTVGGTNPQCGTCYVTVDQLGSTRMVTDPQGTVWERHDYMPFGEELYAGVGVRTTAQGYQPSAAAEGISVLMTGQVRDLELASSAMPSGLDFFESRYFSSAQGRFTSPDAMIMKKEWLADPQRWNHYAYVRNNPLRYVDPNGEDLTIIYSYGPDASEEQKKWFEANKAKIFAQIQKKFNDAGVKNVAFKSADSLSKAELNKLANSPVGNDNRTTGITGGARLEVTGQESSVFKGYAPLGTYGATYHGLSDVFMDRQGNASSSSCDAVCGFANIAAHEIGHGLGFDDPGHNFMNYIGFAPTVPNEWFKDNVMKQGGDPYEKPLPFRPDKNQRVIDEVNRAKPFPQ